VLVPTLIGVVGTYVLSEHLWYCHFQCEFAWLWYRAFLSCQEQHRKWEQQVVLFGEGTAVGKFSCREWRRVNCLLAHYFDLQIARLTCNARNSWLMSIATYSRL